MDHTDTLKPPAFSHPKAEHPSIPRGISLMIWQQWSRLLLLLQLKITCKTSI